MNNYWLSRGGGEPEGPFAESQIVAMWYAGQFVATDMLCMEGASDWRPASAIMLPPKEPEVLPVPTPRANVIVRPPRQNLAEQLPLVMSRPDPVPVAAEETAQKWRRWNFMGWGCLVPTIYIPLVLLFGKSCAMEMAAATISQEHSHFDGKQFAEEVMVFYAILLGASILWWILANFRRQCSRCGEKVASEARMCPHCRAKFTKR